MYHIAGCTANIRRPVGRTCSLWEFLVSFSSSFSTLSLSRGRMLRIRSRTVHHRKYVEASSIRATFQHAALRLYSSLLHVYGSLASENEHRSIVSLKQTGHTVGYLFCLCVQDLAAAILQNQQCIGQEPEYSPECECVVTYCVVCSSRAPL